MPDVPALSLDPTYGSDDGSCRFAHLEREIARVCAGLRFAGVRSVRWLATDNDRRLADSASVPQARDLASGAERSHASRFELLGEMRDDDAVVGESVSEAFNLVGARRRCASGVFLCNDLDSGAITEDGHGTAFHCGAVR